MDLQSESLSTKQKERNQLAEQHKSDEETEDFEEHHEKNTIRRPTTDLITNRKSNSRNQPKRKVLAFPLAIVYHKHREEIIARLVKLLLQLYNDTGLSLSRIPYEDILVEIQGDSIEFLFAINSSFTSEPSSFISSQDYEYLLHTLNTDFLILTIQSIPNWTEGFWFSIPPQMLTQYRSFRVRNSDQYSVIYKGDMGGRLVHLKHPRDPIKIQGISKEAFLHMHLPHANILRCYGVSNFKGQETLVLDAFPCLFDVLNKIRYSLKNKLEIIIGLGQGLSFMHMKKILSLNISPWSIFKVKNTTFAIGDLENSAIIGYENITPRSYKEPLYASPEALKGVKNTSCDIYSYGCLCYYILTQNHYKETSDFSGINRNIADLLTQILDENPQQRPNAATCVESFIRIFNEIA